MRHQVMSRSRQTTSGVPTDIWEREFAGIIVEGKVQSLGDPGTDKYTLNQLIKDPIHCIIGSHTHCSAEEICYSAICSILQKSPGGTYEKIWAHIPKETATQENIDNRLATEDMIAKGPQMCYYIGMSAMLILAKPISPKGENYEYLTKRWKAMLAGLNLTSQLDTGVAGQECRKLLMRFSAESEANKRLRDIYIRFILKLFLEDTLPGDSTIKAVVDQVKMVWTNHGMYTLTEMERIINENVLPLGCAAIADEAIRLKKELNTLRQRAGALFPYSNLLGIVQSELANGRFPNLYTLLKVSTRDTETMKNFTWSQSITSSLHPTQLKKMLRGMKQVSILSDEQLRELQTLGLLQGETVDTLRSQYRHSKRRREVTPPESEDSDEESQEDDRRKRR